MVAAVKVAVLTTSYPRGPADSAGRFVADAVAGVRAAGVEVAVVSPADFADFGIAHGAGIAQNLRAAPWRTLLVPAFLAAYARAARRAARGADLVHAHWLPSALPALATGKPVVVQVWGTDLVLARRAPRLATALLRRAAVVVAASSALADEARALGARRVELVPSGVDVPDGIAEPTDPPHVLYVGRLSREKGTEDFAAATEGMARVVVGDGPLRSVVPDAVGWVPPAELGARYDRAAVVCVPSRREGYGMTLREAMAHGRAVVSTGVGGLADAVEDGRTGLVVPPGDPAALREAVERLLGDPALRARLGAAAQQTARERFSRAAETKGLLRAWEAALYRGGG
jgi:glycosyltransferase involved in cell wall biosynthesis